MLIGQMSINLPDQDATVFVTHQAAIVMKSMPLMTPIEIK